jgi:hypothetical protein
MIDRPELEADVTRWLTSDAPARAPALILESTLERVATERQERYLSQRIFGNRVGRSPGLRWALLAATLSVALGGTIVGGGALLRTMQAPAPTPTTPPRPSLPTFSGTTTLEAGTYAISTDGASGNWREPAAGGSAAPGPLITVTVPDGWFGKVGNTVLKLGPRPLRDASLTIGGIENLYADVCHWQKGQANPPIGPTVDDLAAGLATRSSVPLTPTAIEIDGFAGKYVELTTPSDMSGCDQRVARIETFGDDRVHLQGEHLVYRILDVEGTRLVITAVDFSETSAADRAALQSVVESIRIYR